MTSSDLQNVKAWQINMGYRRSYKLSTA